MSLPISSLTYHSRDRVMGQQRKASKGRKWTPQEDLKLRLYVNTYGARDWKKVARNLDLGKSGSSCSQRWRNYLAPGLKHGKFTDDEKNLIRTLHSLYGNKWATIARELPGRTDNAIKNFCNTHLVKEAGLPNADVESNGFPTILEVGQVGPTATATLPPPPPPGDVVVVSGKPSSPNEYIPLEWCPHDEMVNNGWGADLVCVSAVPFRGGDPNNFDDLGFYSQWLEYLTITDLEG